MQKPNDYFTGNQRNCLRNLWNLSYFSFESILIKAAWFTKRS